MDLHQHVDSVQLVDGWVIEGGLSEAGPEVWASNMSAHPLRAQFGAAGAPSELGEEIWTWFRLSLDNTQARLAAAIYVW